MISSMHKFIKQNISTLQHFVESGGYPLLIHEGHMYVKKSEAKAICSRLPALAIDGNYLIKDPKVPFSDEFLAVYWKLRFEEERKEANRLYNIISGAKDKADE